MAWHTSIYGNCRSLPNSRTLLLPSLCNVCKISWTVKHIIHYIPEHYKDFPCEPTARWQLYPIWHHFGRSLCVSSRRTYLMHPTLCICMCWRYSQDRFHCLTLALLTFVGYLLEPLTFSSCCLSWLPVPLVYQQQGTPPHYRRLEAVYGTYISHSISLYLHCWHSLIVSSHFEFLTLWAAVSPVFPQRGCAVIEIGWKWCLVRILDIISAYIHISYLGSFYPACFLFFNPLASALLVS